MITQKPAGFVQHFREYAYNSDSITCEVAGFTCTATIYRDDTPDRPDERDDGFWPSLDAKSAGYIGNKSARTLRRKVAEAKAIMEAWERDEWWYVGVAVTVSRAGVELTGTYDHALWGVECNYPIQDRIKRNRYLRDCANELLPDALEAADTKINQLLEAIAS